MFRGNFLRRFAIVSLQMVEQADEMIESRQAQWAFERASAVADGPMILGKILCSLDFLVLTLRPVHPDGNREATDCLPLIKKKEPRK